MLNKLAIVLSLCLAACAADSEPEPDAGPDREDQCALWCSEIDEDLSSLPPQQCPGPDDDTSYLRCLGECVGRMPAGNWCFPP
jgi:hypothetical protein